MTQLKKSYLALVAAGMLAMGAAGTAQAAPIASAVSVVSFENFTINWNTAARQVNAATDFGTLSVTSSQLTAANMTGFAGISMNPSSSTGAPLVAESVLGTVPASITGVPGATSSTVFNVPTLPLVGNFSASASNERGAPALNFPNSTTPVTANADLHNASYASLDTLNGTAGTSTSSQLASTMTFVSLVGGDSLRFNFDAGNYIGAFLSTGAAQSASASWSIAFTLINTTAGTIAGFFNVGDTISNNAPGSGTTLAGALNSAVVGGIATTSPLFFNSAPIVAGNTYQLTANISTRAQVERVPEPATLALLGIGLLGLGAMSRKNKKSSGSVSA